MAVVCYFSLGNVKVVTAMEALYRAFSILRQGRKQGRESAFFGTWNYWD